jgi:hypothetical protein
MWVGNTAFDESPKRAMAHVPASAVVPTISTNNVADMRDRAEISAVQ